MSCGSAACFTRKKSVILKQENPTIFSNDDIIYKSNLFFKCLSAVLHKKTDLCIKRLSCLFYKNLKTHKRSRFSTKTTYIVIHHVSYIVIYHVSIYFVISFYLPYIWQSALFSLKFCKNNIWELRSSHGTGCPRRRNRLRPVRFPRLW